MESLYFLVPCVLIFLVLAVKVLFWAINSGQYDNLNTEAHRILFEAETSGTNSSAQDVSNTSAVANDSAIDDTSTNQTNGTVPSVSESASPSEKPH